MGGPRISVVGVSGAGKSTLARAFADAVLSTSAARDRRP